MVFLLLLYQHFFPRSFRTSFTARVITAFRWAAVSRATSQPRHSAPLANFNVLRTSLLYRWTALALHDCSPGCYTEFAMCRRYTSLNLPMVWINALPMGGARLTSCIFSEQSYAQSLLVIYKGLICKMLWARSGCTCRETLRREWRVHRGRKVNSVDSIDLVHGFMWPEQKAVRKHPSNFLM